MRNPTRWFLHPPKKGEMTDVWILIALAAMLVVSVLINEPCNETSQQQSTRQAELCE